MCGEGVKSPKGRWHYSRRHRAAHRAGLPGHVLVPEKISRVAARPLALDHHHRAPSSRRAPPPPPHPPPPVPLRRLQPPHLALPRSAARSRAHGRQQGIASPYTPAPPYAPAPPPISAGVSGAAHPHSLPPLFHPAPLSAPRHVCADVSHHVTRRQFVAWRGWVRPRSGHTVRTFWCHQTCAGEVLRRERGVSSL